MIIAIIIAVGVLALVFMALDEYVQSEVTMLLFVFIAIVILVFAVIERAFLIVAFLTVWYFITGSFMPLITFIRTHPWQTIGYIAGYFLIGAIWSCVKWGFAETDRVSEAREDYTKRIDTKQTWEEFAAKRKMDPTHYKEDIIIWIAFWPINFLWTISHDFVRRVCKRIYNELLRVYRGISNYVWK